ncbi:hypothetical protein Lal_00027024 [Lupinus albus]|nr:hypothetical protein Lal_00027024 [Lupinus albus]
MISIINLTTKTIEGPSLSLESINNIHSSNRLPPSMFSISNCITNHILQEDFENTSRLFINQTTDSFHTSSSRQSPNRRFCDSLNVVAQNLSMPLRATFAQTLSTFSTTRHVFGGRFGIVKRKKSEGLIGCKIRGEIYAKSGTVDGFNWTVPTGYVRNIGSRSKLSKNVQFKVTSAISTCN